MFNRASIDNSFYPFKNMKELPILLLPFYFLYSLAVLWLDAYVN